MKIKGYEDCAICGERYHGSDIDGYLVQLDHGDFVCRDVCFDEAQTVYSESPGPAVSVEAVLDPIDEATGQGRR